MPRNPAPAADAPAADAAPVTPPAAETVHPLIAKRDALILAHDAIKGNDQSSIARRAGKVRQINILQLDLTLEGVTFAKWTSPASVKVSKGTSVSDADLIASILTLTRFMDAPDSDADMVAVADTRRASKVKTALDRGLVTVNEGGQYTGLSETGQVAADAAAAAAE